MGKIARIINKYFHLNFKEKANINSRFSLAGNAFVAVCKMVMGIFSTSIFLFISAFYSLGCAASKQTYFVGLAHSKIDKEQESKYYLKIAIMLLFTDIIYIIYMIRLFFIPSVSHYPKIVGIALATISTLEMYFAISGLIKSKKRNELLLSGLKCVSLSTALLSIVLAQTAILSFTMPELDSSIYNAITGTSLGFVCIIIAIAMFFKYNSFVKSKKLAQKAYQFKVFQNNYSLSEILKYQEVLLNVENIEISILDTIKDNNIIIDDYVDLTSDDIDHSLDRCKLSKKLGSDYLLVDNIDQYCAENPNNIDNIKLLIKELDAIKLPVIIGNANNFFNQYNNDKEVLDKIYGIYQKNFIIDVINKNNDGKVLLNKIEDNYKRIYTTEQALDKKQEQKILEFAINHDCNVDIENS